MASSSASSANSSSNKLSSSSWSSSLSPSSNGSEPSSGTSMSSFRSANDSSSFNEDSNSVESTSSSRSSSLNNSSSESSLSSISLSMAVDRSAILSSTSGAGCSGNFTPGSAGDDLRFISHTARPAINDRLNKAVPAISAMGLVSMAAIEFSCSACFAARSLSRISFNSR